MVVKTVRLSAQAKDRLSRLKGKTGIKNWNVLSRWAFCYSLKEGTVPANVPVSFEGGVEMSWPTFGGDFADVYEMALIDWCRDAGVGDDPETIERYLSLHLERGIAHLSGTNFIKSIDDLLTLSYGGLK